MELALKKLDKALWEDHDMSLEFPEQKPLLAHYTSINNFDLILEEEELWLSNPLNMNDSNELMFGMRGGVTEFKKNKALMEVCGDQETHVRLLKAFDDCFKHFEDNYVLDTYMLCFSLHEEEDFDGSLSMWRGYGADGSGVSLVIDTNKITPNKESPITLRPVDYATAKEQTDWIKTNINALAKTIKDFEKTDKILKMVAEQWIERLKIYSLFTKHKGFEDEKEWRFVYLSDRDTEHRYSRMLGYYISPKGVEPKLKLKLEKIPSNDEKLTLEKLIDRIILGPAASSELSARSLKRMLKIKSKPELTKKVYASTIPYRP